MNEDRTLQDGQDTRLPRYSATRRQFLASAAAALALPAAARAQAGLRVATLDWAILETLLALGADVVAATELAEFRKVAVTPAVPETVADLGLRGTPNFEVLRFTRPDLILNSNFYGWANDRIAHIAPVETHSVYVPGELPYALAETMTRAIGTRLGLPGAAYADEVAGEMRRIRGALAGQVERPVLVINLGDARHFRVFGADSMFGEALTRIGFGNAWDQPTSYSAMAPVGIEALAAYPDAFIALVDPTPEDARAVLETSAFWQALPAVAAGRVLSLGAINPYGALPAARRFATQFEKAMNHARQG